MALKRKAEKEEQKRIDAENAILFRKVEEKQKPQTIPPGVDPKSVLCIYFKQGNCQAAANCKFGHDLALDGKREKADMFTDNRKKAAPLDDEALKTTDMSSWDLDTLQRMVAKKNTGPVNASEKVCRQFLKAVEDKRWGWFWECPNGGARCPYRHALPPGYVFKEDKKKDVETRTLEEILEEERAKLSGGTKVTPETFAVWAEKIKKQKQDELEKSQQWRAKALKAGQARMTGREFLTQEGYVDPDATDDEDGEDVDLLALIRQKKTRRRSFGCGKCPSR